MAHPIEALLSAIDQANPNENESVIAYSLNVGKLLAEMAGKIYPGQPLAADELLPLTIAMMLDYFQDDAAALEKIEAITKKLESLYNVMSDKQSEISEVMHGMASGTQYDDLSDQYGAGNYTTTTMCMAFMSALEELKQSNIQQMQQDAMYRPYIEKINLLTPEKYVALRIQHNKLKQKKPQTDQIREEMAPIFEALQRHENCLKRQSPALQIAEMRTRNNIRTESPDSGVKGVKRGEQTTLPRKDVIGGGRLVIADDEVTIVRGETFGYPPGNFVRSGGPKSTGEGLQGATYATDSFDAGNKGAQLVGAMGGYQHAVKEGITLDDNLIDKICSMFSKDEIPDVEKFKAALLELSGKHEISLPLALAIEGAAIQADIDRKVAGKKLEDDIMPLLEAEVGKIYSGSLSVELGTSFRAITLTGKQQAEVKGYDVQNAELRKGMTSKNKPTKHGEETKPSVAVYDTDKNGVSSVMVVQTHQDLDDNDCFIAMKGEDIETIIDFYDEAVAAKEPLVVNCTDGIDRTGVMLTALTILNKQMSMAEEDPDFLSLPIEQQDKIISDIIDQLRRDREPFFMRKEEDIGRAVTLGFAFVHAKRLKDFKIEHDVDNLSPEEEITLNDLVAKRASSERDFQVTNYEDSLIALEAKASTTTSKPKAYFDPENPREDAAYRIEEAPISVYLEILAEGYDIDKQLDENGHGIFHYATETYLSNPSKENLVGLTELMKHADAQIKKSIFEPIRDYALENPSQEGLARLSALVKVGNKQEQKQAKKDLSNYLKDNPDKVNPEARRQVKAIAKSKAVRVKHFLKKKIIKPETREDIKREVGNIKPIVQGTARKIGDKIGEEVKGVQAKVAHAKAVRAARKQSEQPKTHPMPDASMINNILPQGSSSDEKKLLDDIRNALTIEAAQAKITRLLEDNDRFTQVKIGAEWFETDSKKDGNNEYFAKTEFLERVQVALDIVIADMDKRAAEEMTQPTASEQTKDTQTPTISEGGGKSKTEGLREIRDSLSRDLGTVAQTAEQKARNLRGTIVDGAKEVQATAAQVPNPFKKLKDKAKSKKSRKSEKSDQPKTHPMPDLDVINSALPEGKTNDQNRLLSDIRSATTVESAQAKITRLLENNDRFLQVERGGKWFETDSKQDGNNEYHAENSFLRSIQAGLSSIIKQMDEATVRESQVERATPVTAQYSTHSQSESSSTTPNTAKLSEDTQKLISDFVTNLDKARENNTDVYMDGKLEYLKRELDGAVSFAQTKGTDAEAGTYLTTVIKRLAQETGLDMVAQLEKAVELSVKPKEQELSVKPK